MLLGQLENAPDWLGQYRRKVPTVEVQQVLPNTKKIHKIKKSYQITWPGLCQGTDFD
jgi:hypothetical protein